MQAKSARQVLDARNIPTLVEMHLEVCSGHTHAIYRDRNFPKTGNLADNFGPVDVKLADLFQTYWTNFAKNGNPNSASPPDWKAFGASPIHSVP